MSKNRSKARAVESAPLGLPRPVWLALVALDALLFVFGLLGARIELSLVALVLAVVIDKCARGVLVGAYEEREQAARAASPKVTREQCLEAVRLMKAERKERRKAREARSAREA